LQQRKLEKEKEELTQDRDTISQIYEASLMRIEMEKERTRSEEQSRQLLKSLLDYLNQVEIRDMECETKLKAAQLAKQSLERAQLEARDKAELLSKQLEIFRQYGLSSEEKVFQQTLREAKKVFKRQQLQVQAPKCFISYAWENMRTQGNGEAANLSMQRWLRRLSNDLLKLKCKVCFNLDDMQGNLRNTIRSNIEQSNCFIIICTPQWKQRIEEGLTPLLKDCLENDRVAQLEMGLKTGTTNQRDRNFDPCNNTSFEFLHIWAKVRMQPSSNSLFLLHFSGSLEEAILPVLKKELIRTVTKHTDEEYYELLAKVSDPVGLISCIFGLKKDGLLPYSKEYEFLVKMFYSELSLIKDKMEKVESSTRFLPSVLP